MILFSFSWNIQTAQPENVAGNGKFYFSNDATYEGDWLLIPDKIAAEIEGENVEEEAQNAEGEEGSSEEKAEETEEEIEPSGLYLRHGKGRYVEGEYSYDGDWENVSDIHYLLAIFCIVWLFYLKHYASFRWNLFGLYKFNIRFSSFISNLPGQIRF